MNAIDTAMLQAGIGVNVAALKTAWMQRVSEVLQEATLNVPAESWMQEGGKEGRHTEQLGYVLAELQFMQRAYPDMEW